MLKTLFRKYLFVTLLIVMVSFVFLGTVMIVFISRYWQTEKRSLLLQDAYSVAQIAGDSLISVEDNQYMVDTEKISGFISAFSTNIDADIMMTNMSGQPILYHGENQRIQQAVTFDPDGGPSGPSVISQTVMEKTLAGTFNEVTTLDNLYDNTSYVVGVPITVQETDGHVRNIGAVFAVSNMSFFSLFREEAVKVFLLAAVAAFMIAFGVVWIFSYKLAQPLRKMAAAARSFGAGDFSVRVEISSDDEIGHLAQAFNNMAVSLSSSETMSRNFIANVSHELKTPMTTIAGFIDGILDGTIPPEKQDYYLQIVSQEVKRLSRLVRTMLDLSKIDSGELKLRPARFDLSNTIFLALLSFEKNIEDKNIEIRGLEDSKPDFIDGDPDMIHQVLYNLIENAVKFTNEGGYIQISVKDEGSRHVVSIRNSGPGIPADEVGMIFDRFYKTDKSRSQDKNGMGLGLYIVKTIIKLHGGEITVSSVENEYTEFSFWLPKLEEKKKAGKPLAKTSKPEKNGEVVVQAIERIEGEVLSQEDPPIVDITDQVTDVQDDSPQKPS